MKFEEMADLTPLIRMEASLDTNILDGWTGPFIQTYKGFVLTRIPEFLLLQDYYDGFRSDRHVYKEEIAIDIEWFIDGLSEASEEEGLDLLEHYNLGFQDMWEYNRGLKIDEIPVAFTSYQLLKALEIMLKRKCVFKDFNMEISKSFSLKQISWDDAKLFNKLYFKACCEADTIYSDWKERRWI